MTAQFFILIAGLLLILFGVNYIVDGASSIAKRFGVSEFIIGVTIVGIGTSAPEMVVSFMSAIQGKADMAIGNIVGSNIFNLSFILGVSSQINALAGGGITFVDYAVMIGAAVLLLICALNKKISRLEGAIMFAAFIAYNVYLISTQTL